MASLERRLVGHLCEFMTYWVCVCGCVCVCACVFFYSFSGWKHSAVAGVWWMATRVQDARRPLQIGPAETWQAQLRMAQAHFLWTTGETSRNRVRWRCRGGFSGGVWPSQVNPTHSVAAPTCQAAPLSCQSVAVTIRGWRAEDGRNWNAGFHQRTEICFQLRSNDVLEHLSWNKCSEKKPPSFFSLRTDCQSAANPSSLFLTIPLYHYC